MKQIEHVNSWVKVWWKWSHIDNDKYSKFVWSLARATLSWVLQLSSAIKDISNQSLALEDFKKELKKNIAPLAWSTNEKERFVYKTMNEALTYDWSEEDEFIKWLIKSKDEKFSIIKQIINEELSKNKILSDDLKQVEQWKKPLTKMSALQKLVNPNVKVEAKTINNDLLKKLANNQSRFETSLKNLSESNNDQTSKDIENAKNDILKKVRTWMDSFSWELKQWKKLELWEQSLDKNYAWEAAGSSSSSNQYSFNYEWIYIFNSAGQQTRLFNYLDEVKKDSTPIELDSDWDWDMDVIYKMWDSLFIKENLKNAATLKHISWVDSMKDMWDINSFLWLASETSDVPFAPNFFTEISSKSNTVNFWFSPANYLKNKSFRLEYHDYLDRFDRTNNLKINNKGMEPISRLNFVDMVTNMEEENISKANERYMVKDNFASIAWWIWDATVSLPSYKVLWWWEALTVQEWKTIYAWESWLALKYKFDWEENYQIINLQKRSSIKFNDTSSVTILNWNAILQYPSTMSFTWNINDLVWFPVLPWMKIEFSNKNSYVNIDYVWWNLLTVDNLSTYQMYDLGDKQPNYTVNIKVDNSFYYAKMYEFSKGTRSNLSNMTLLSPQLQSDNSPPIISVDWWIRIPVYKQTNISLKKYITDVSGISEAWVDMDLEKDSDWDWILTNDKDSLNPNNPYWVFKWNWIYDIKAWPFDHLFKKKVMVGAKDNNNNVAMEEVDFEVYSPVPEIKETKSDKVIWTLDEKLSEEPIDVFRFRNWVMTLIKPKDEINSKTDTNWSFWVETEKSASWLVIKDANGKLIANVNETTWKIDIKDSWFKLEVSSADSDNRTTINLIDKTKWSIVFKQDFSLPENQNIAEVSKFENLTKWIFFKPTSADYKLIKNSSSAPYLPNWAFIIDAINHKAIIGIWIDWNLYIMNSDFILEYSANWDNVMFIVKSKAWSELWSILMNVSGEYIIK